MTYKIVARLILMALLIGCAKPKIIHQTFDSGKIIHGSQTKNIDNLSDYAVYLDKGDTIPLKISVNSEILDVADDSIHLVLKKKVYFRVEVPDALKNDKAASMSEAEKNKHLRNMKFYISPDGVRWASIYDSNGVEAIKQVFGIKGGSWSVGLGISNKEGVNAFIKAKTDSIK